MALKRLSSIKTLIIFKPFVLDMNFLELMLGCMLAEDFFAKCCVDIVVSYVDSQPNLNSYIKSLWVNSKAGMTQLHL